MARRAAAAAKTTNSSQPKNAQYTHGISVQQTNISGMRTTL